ncbi:hypothetical protein [Caballeronia grimmiae]|uniref:hypothetical protein n=1 Tax=Caballeronia grimmiae TaxID=1071679 RepID=UPI0038BAFB93
MSKQFIRAALLLLIMGPLSAMASNKSFSIVTNGSASGEALTEVSIEDGRFELILRGDTRDAEMPGIGIFCGHLAPTDDELVSAVHSGDRAGGTVPFFRVQKLLRSMYESGERVEKLDVVADISVEKNGLLITIEFTNSGRSPISFPSPATWKGTFNPIMQHSWILITGVATEKTDSADADLSFTTPWFGGAQLINRSDFNTDVLDIPPGTTKTAKFLVPPSNPSRGGRYKIGVSICIEEILQPSKLKGGPVEFIGRSLTVDFPDGYHSVTARSSEERQLPSSKGFDR